MRKIVFVAAAIAALATFDFQGEGQVVRPLRLQPIAPALRQAALPSTDMPYALATHPALQRPASIARSSVLTFVKITETQFLNLLCSDIDKRFKNKSVGYQVVVVLPDGNWCGRAGGSARHAPDSGARTMTVEDKITIASVSKTITASAMLHAMTARKISVDAKIAGYLPDDWVQGPNIASITFRDLFTHKSGFRCGDKYKGAAIIFSGLKQCVQDGVNLADKTQLYRNENYALMRILLHQFVTKKVGLAVLPLLSNTTEGGGINLPPDNNLPGMMQPHGGVATPKPNVTPAWGASDYADYYISYVNQTVFGPVDLPQLYCKPTDAAPALSYKSTSTNVYDFNTLGPGEIWGDMTLACGSQGWNLSAHQLAIFMHGLTHSSSIVPAAVMQRMEDENLGLWYSDHGGGLASWSHGGYHPAEYNLGEVNTLIVAFNNGLTASVIINSKFNGDFFAELVGAVKATALAPSAPPP